MAENPETPAGGAPSGDQQPRLTIVSQYIKDLSFENPRAPLAAWRPSQGRPEIQIRVDVRAPAAWEPSATRSRSSCTPRPRPATDRRSWSS